MNTAEEISTIQSLGEPELLAQLAEEAAELAQAALKLRRVYTGDNPTPVTEQTAKSDLLEESADVALCLETLGISAADIRIRQIKRFKRRRWATRIAERRGEA